MPGIGRREFMASLAGVVLNWRMIAVAQQKAMPAIGWFLGGNFKEQHGEIFLAAVSKGLAEYGFVEGRDWPAPGSEDTELGVFMGPEVSHGATKVYAGIQA